MASIIATSNKAPQAIKPVESAQHSDNKTVDLSIKASKPALLDEINGKGIQGSNQALKFAKGPSLHFLEALHSGLPRDLISALTLSLNTSEVRHCGSLQKAVS